MSYIFKIIIVSVLKYTQYNRTYYTGTELLNLSKTYDLYDDQNNLVCAKIKVSGEICGDQKQRKKGNFDQHFRKKLCFCHVRKTKTPRTFDYEFPGRSQ